MRPLTEMWSEMMSTGLNYLDLAIGIAVIAGIFWWIFTLSTKSSAQRKQERGNR
jgi:hypothetical protein